MAEIKISELSVGDWVMYRDREWQICSLYQFTEEVGLWRKDSQFCEYVSDLSPIPLTPEILEKNGFEKVDSQWYMCELNGIHISVIVWGNQRGRIEISYKSPFDDDNPLYIADFTANIPHISVHHLQRVLRLAGVEKEIEL